MMESFKSIKAPMRMSEVIAHEIEKRIINHELKPGNMLPSEGILKEQFSVSRNTVREALRILEASGLIRILQGAKGGPFVSQITNEFISDFLIKAVRLGGISGDSIAQFRIAIEPSMAATLATKDLNDDFFPDLERNIKETEELFRANDVTAYENLEFHRLLALETGNPLFVIIMNTLTANLQISSPILRNHCELHGHSIEDHKKIMRAIKNKDPKKTQNYMLHHLLEIREVVRDADFKPFVNKGEKDGD